MADFILTFSIDADLSGEQLAPLIARASESAVRTILGDQNVRSVSVSEPSPAAAASDETSEPNDPATGSL